MTSLRQQMVDAMRQRGFSERTHRSYLGAVRDLARFHGRSPAELGIPELEQYFRHLAVEHGLSGASCRVHRNAVRFLYLHALNGWVQLHPEVLYRRLFQVTWDTLRRFGQDPRRLGGELGMTAVLHTWGQNLSQHVHLHCLIPGGALQADGRWKPSRGQTPFPVRALSRRFRGAMVAALRRAVNEGELHRVTHPGEIDAVLDRLMATEWAVYAKDCLDHSATVVDYLARYTHRIAISNARILDIDAREVTFRYTDNRDYNRTQVMRLEGEEFVRRFLLHILPKGLMRVRHYGFLANRCRKVKLARIRQALNQPPPEASADPEAGREPATYPCPRCRVGRVNVYDPDPTDEQYETTIVYLIRDHGHLRIETEHWTMGIFSVDIWRRVLRETGFVVHEGQYNLGEDEYTVFACVKM